MTVTARPFVIVNPMAARGRVGRQWPEISRLIEREAGAFDFAMTEHPTHATELARVALKSGYRTIGSLGGDGTHSLVVNGFFEGGEPIAPDAALAVLPIGTGGDFKRMLPFDGDDVREFARVMVGAPAKPIDVGLLDYVRTNGRPEQCVFLNIASFGIGGLVDRIVPKTTRALGGSAAYLIATVQAIFRYDPPVVRITADGVPLAPVTLFVAGACNGRYFGGGMKFGPNAELSDGKLDLVVMPWRGKRHHLLRGTDIYSGSHVEKPGVQVLRITELTAEADRDCWLDVDGEAPGKLPISIRILPRAVRLRGL